MFVLATPPLHILICVYIHMCVCIHQGLLSRSRRVGHVEPRQLLTLQPAYQALHPTASFLPPPSYTPPPLLPPPSYPSLPNPPYSPHTTPRTITSYPPIPTPP